MDKNHDRATKISIRELTSTLTTNPALSANFIINELESALKFVKPGTAAGFDGAYLEFIRNCGERTKEWLISYMNMISYRQPDCQNCSNGPKGYHYSKTRQRWF
jgi:hypothetical protein